MAAVRAQVGGQGGDKAVAGPETERVCLRAARLLAEYHLVYNVQFVLPAGYDPTYHAMMNTAMRKVLLEHNVAADQIKMLESPEYTTAGETVAAARYIARDFVRGEEVKIMLVVRWWHAARAEWLLRQFLRNQGLHSGKDYEIQVVTVWSLDLYGMAREVVGWIKNLWRAKYGFHFKDY